MTELLDSPSSETDEEEETRELVIDIEPPPRSSELINEEERKRVFFEKIKAGDIASVRKIIKKYPSYCTTKDEFERYPIVTALIDDGGEDMMRLLIRSCPESLHFKTPSGETLLHWSLRQEKWNCFSLLCKTHHRRKDRHILDMPARQTGETYREIAVQRRFLKPCDKVGRSTTRTISNVSEENSARTPNEPTVWSAALTMMVLIAGGSFAAPLSYHGLYPVLAADQGKIVNLSMHDLFTYPSAIMDGFLFFTTITVAFISAMLGILVAVCMIFRRREWGTALAVFTFFVITSMLVSFCSTLNKLFPRVVRIDGVHVEFPGGVRIDGVHVEFPGGVRIDGVHVEFPAGSVLVFYSVYVIILASTLALIAQRIRGAL
uniref:PGG domain-containing protein n=1 Tax=Nicotiana tabacum TaxID=4097 RepID=A0A1S4B867_TOBAC|nr:PREDICTED: uncharacterized protein LOC107805504 [Nicotiana tabacum]